MTVIVYYSIVHGHKMLPLIKAMLITVILETIIFESYEGKTDDLIYQAAAKTPQLSKHARSLQHFTNYRGPEAGVLLEKRQNCNMSSDCPTWSL